MHAGASDGLAVRAAPERGAMWAAGELAPRPTPGLPAG